MTVAQTPAFAPPGGCWSELELDGRGRTYAFEHPGPPGAPTVVLLHGWIASGSSNWARTLDALSARYRVLALDHRGHGRGIRSSDPFTLEDCADDVIALLDVARVDRATLIGYSMGGPIAQLAWQRHPHRVEALVMYATAARFSVPAISSSALRTAAPMVSATVAMARPMVLRAMRPVAAIVVDDQGTGSYGSWLDAIAAHDVTSILQAGHEVLGFDSRGWIDVVDIPTAVIVTTRDRVVPPERQRELASLVPGSVVLEREGTHRLPFSDPCGSTAAVLDACGHVVPRPVPVRTRRRARSIRARWRAWRAGRSEVDGGRSGARRRRRRRRSQ